MKKLEITTMLASNMACYLSEALCLFAINYGLKVFQEIHAQFEEIYEARKD